jgi:hypothetical protein
MKFQFNEEKRMELIEIVKERRFKIIVNRKNRGKSTVSHRPNYFNTHTKDNLENKERELDEKGNDIDPLLGESRP